MQTLLCLLMCSQVHESISYSIKDYRSHRDYFSTIRIWFLIKNKVKAMNRLERNFN